ncbi:MAG TPA: holo-ACP synthase [Rubrobacter sp.]|nr:holo-ACP synthase [Rubrobacter sp.]
MDIIETGRVAKVLKRHPERFLSRVYTPLEIAFCRGRIPELAARFAGKEAVMKALGTGARGLGWREIEILPNKRGKPMVYLHGKAAGRAEEIGLLHADISLTHIAELSLAFVVASLETGVEGMDDPHASRLYLEEWLRERGRLQ